MTIVQPTHPIGVKDQVERVAGLHARRCGALLGILEQLQEENSHNYLPPAVLAQVARSMKLPPSQIYSVATFYAFFNLKPQGKHTVTICRGTACHTRGSKPLLEALERTMGFDTPANGLGSERLNRTTEDARFTLRTVACFGQCALAPVVELDRVIHGHITERTLLGAVERLDKGGRP